MNPTTLKTDAAYRSSGATSLTPALSRWERENTSPSCPQTRGWICRTAARISRNVQPLFPLPAGEGLGEGAARARGAAWIFSTTALLLAALFLAGCGKSDSAKSGERKVLYYQSAMHPWIKSDKPGRCTVCGMELTPIYEGQTGLDVGGDVITLSSNSVRVLNVQTVEVKRQPLGKTLNVAGTIDDNDATHRVLSAYVGGRIEQLHVGYVGAEVKSGEPLAEFYSPMLLTAVRDYLLVQRGAGEPPALLAAASSRLKQLGLTEMQIAGLPKSFKETDLTLPILAPINGTVTEKKIYAGQYVQEGERLFELADFSTMWFLFRAYEQDLPWIRAGQKVDVSTPSLPGKVVTGVIKFIDPNLDEATRATKVRVELENPLVDGRRLLSHRLYADGVVHLAAPEVLAVPRSAVIQTGPEAIAFVDEGGGGYARRVLKLGRRGDALVEVLDGLSAGDQVVVNGNLLIDGQAEMNRSFSAPVAMAAPTNVSASLPALTDAQRNAVKEFLAQADAVTAALAADDLNKFNTAAAKVHDVTARLHAALAGSEAWLALAKAVEATAHLVAAHDLKEARREFHPFSVASVALAQAARRSGGDIGTLKVFRCPMTKDAFPGAPTRADWIQLQPEVRNPWFGAEMLDCGSEVKP
jgi:Cu(I)/Ag(I) efflux system membrane fusion protein